MQGLGAGAIAPMAITIVGDIYSTAERAKAQGYIASVWGIASVVGPTLGGLLSEYATWRWIFFVNIPLCLLAAAMLTRNFHEQIERGHPRIDYRGRHPAHRRPGAGHPRPCSRAVRPGPGTRREHRVLAAGAVLLAGFWLVERRAPEPVLPLWVFRRRLLVASSLIAAGVGAVVLGLTSYVPTYVQEVLGHRPAGRRLRAGHALDGLADRRVPGRQGLPAHRLPGNCALIGTSVVVVGTALLLLLGESLQRLQVAATCLVIGARHGPRPRARR